MADGPLADQVQVSWPTDWSRRAAKEQQQSQMSGSWRPPPPPSLPQAPPPRRRPRPFPLLPIRVAPAGGASSRARLCASAAARVYGPLGCGENGAQLLFYNLYFASRLSLVIIPTLPCVSFLDLRSQPPGAAGLRAGVLARAQGHLRCSSRVSLQPGAERSPRARTHGSCSSFLSWRSVETA